MKVVFVGSLLLLLVSVSFSIPTVKNDIKDYLLGFEEQIRKNIINSQNEESGKQHNDNNLGFSWKNCGNASIDPIIVNSMDISPDPIVIPGLENINLDAVVKKPIEKPTALKLIIKKKVFGIFVTIPCVDNIGSCTYDDPCTFLQNVTCPAEVLALGWNCRCPLIANTIKVTNHKIEVPKENLPSFIENGEYEIEATLMNGSERVFCYGISCQLNELE